MSTPHESLNNARQEGPRDTWLLPTLKVLVSAAQLAALKSSTRESYWRAAVQTELLTDAQLLEHLAQKSGIPVATELHSPSMVRDIIPESMARRYHVLPLEGDERTLYLAISNPYNLAAEQAIAFATDRRVHLRLASPSQIERGLERLYRPLSALDTILNHFSHQTPVAALHETPAISLPSSQSNILDDDDRPIITLVDHIVTDAIAKRASDLHIEAEDRGSAVRYRIDGVLTTRMLLPVAVGLPLVSRIKIMAQMDIADRLRPQGGRARIRTPGGLDVDLRVSTIPAALGEKVVIRILDPDAALHSLASLGFDTRSAQRLEKLLEVREGLILITGPTGSGKTTTLYAALQQLLQRGLNIVTVEDPVEYRVPGLVQVQVNEKAGLTFASALRSILRQDPDVILIGEVRDQETAAIAIQAALTGHLVFATLHTIDACSSITRLQDLGVEPGKVAASLKGIIAQRLLRRVCKQCVQYRTQHIPTILWETIPSGADLPFPIGCTLCNESGYHGRIATGEVILINSVLQQLVGRGESAKAIAMASRKHGAASLWESGVNHLMAHRTTLDEIRRVLDVEEVDLE